MSTTPNMNIPQPTPGGDDGTWGTGLNTGTDVVDLHDHTAGKGVQVPSSGLNINADLEMNSNRLIETKAVQLDSQNATLTGTTNANSNHAVNGDLWFTNGAGVAVQITNGNTIASASSTNTPAGMVVMYAGSSAPAGYLLCDGSDVSRVTYLTLFGAIGTSYGVGDGATTFTLPNFSGRAPMGVGTYTDTVSGSVTRTLAEVIGAEAHVLTTPELAFHNHPDSGHTHVQVVMPAVASGGANPAGFSNVGPVQNGTQSTATGFANTQPAGGDNAHNNMQPSLGINFIIKT